MKKLSLLLLLVLCTLSVFAQSTSDSSSIYAWRISERLGVITPASVDTAVLNFQNNNPIDRYSIANSYNGNLGSPLQSKLYFNRTAKSDFLFSHPYDAYFMAPSDRLFYNTKIPYVNLTYLTGGPTGLDEDYFKALISMNVNKRLNFSGFIDYMNAMGLYDHQSSGQLNGGVFGSYIGKHYSAHGIFSYNNYNNFENGGIRDDADLGQYESQNIPVRISDAGANYQKIYFYYNQKYTLGFEKKTTINKDSIQSEYIPVTTFAHTLKYEDAYKRYVEGSIPAGFYADNFLSDVATNDSVRQMLLRNTLSVSLNEEYNRLLRFGLTAFAEHDLNRYYYLKETQPTVIFENNLRVGGELSKRKGSAFTYNIGGDFIFLGEDFADFNLYAGIHSTFPLGKSKILFSADASIKNVSPSFFEQQYYSNHFAWENSFDKSFYSTLSGKAELDFPFMHIALGVNYQDIGNYIYFNTDAKPVQWGGNLQVIGVDAALNFKLGHFFLENKLVYQNSSNLSVLPLPEFASFHNLYYQGKWFKVLTVQLGADLSYHTAYKAPAYMPATGVFYVQDNIMVGNYPLASVYANIHIRQTRIFFKYYHFNSSFSGYNYFSMPHYPFNSAMFKLGISWNFND